MIFFFWRDTIEYNFKYRCNYFRNSKISKFTFHFSCINLLKFKIGSENVWVVINFDAFVEIFRKVENDVSNFQSITLIIMSLFSYLYTFDILKWRSWIYFVIIYWVFCHKNGLWSCCEFYLELFDRFDVLEGKYFSTD